MELIPRKYSCVETSSAYKVDFHSWISEAALSVKGIPSFQTGNYMMDYQGWIAVKATLHNYFRTNGCRDDTLPLQLLPQPLSGCDDAGSASRSNLVEASYTGVNQRCHC